jgi:hypothetical protein
VAVVLPRRTDRLSSVSSSPEFASLTARKQSKNCLSASAVMRNQGDESRINVVGVWLVKGRRRPGAIRARIARRCPGRASKRTRSSSANE